LASKEPHFYLILFDKTTSVARILKKINLIDHIFRQSRKNVVNEVWGEMLKIRTKTTMAYDAIL